jgi:DNA-binding MarR family transcriptional regulator
MPTVEKVVQTNSGLASELRVAAVRLRRRLVNERHPDNELSLSAMAVLGRLHRSDEELSIGEIAQQEGVQPPSMTRTVTCLERDGYVVRRRHATDGRQVVVALTERGRATVLADRARRDAWLARRLSELTPDERHALRAAVPILQRLASA